MFDFLSQNRKNGFGKILSSCHLVIINDFVILKQHCALNCSIIIIIICNQSEKIKRVCVHKTLNFLFIQFPCAPLRGKIIGMCLIKTFSMKSINCFRLCRSSFFTVNILQYISCIHQKHIWLILSFSLTHFMLLIIIVTVANQYARPCQKNTAYVTCDR